jgi:hypothetical protein
MEQLAYAPVGVVADILLQLQHPVQYMTGDANLDRSPAIQARSQPVADHLLVAPGGGFNPAPLFCNQTPSAIRSGLPQRCLGDGSRAGSARSSLSRWAPPLSAVAG